MDDNHAYCHLGFGADVVSLDRYLQVSRAPIAVPHFPELRRLGSLLLKVFIFVFSHVWPFIPIGAVMIGMDIMVFTTPIFWLGFILTPFAVIAVDLTVVA